MFPKRLLAICMGLVTTLGMATCASRPARTIQTSEAPPLPYAGGLQTALDQTSQASHIEDELGIPAINRSGSTYGYTATSLADAIMGRTWSALSNALPEAKPSETVKSSKPLLKKFVNGG